MFAREVNPGLTSLVKKLEAATQTHADVRFRAVVVLLADDEKLEDKLKELAAREKLKKVVLAIESPAGPPGYDIAKGAEVTVLLYEKKKVKRNLAFEKGKLTEAAVSDIAAAVKDFVPAPKGDK